MAEIFFNGEFVPEEKAFVSVRTHALNYGTGCFEGIRAYYNAEEKELYVLKLKEHYERLLNSAKILRIKVDYTVQQLCDLTVELLVRNQFASDAYIRPLLYKADTSVKVDLGSLKDGIAIYAVPLGDYLSTQGIRVMTSTWRRVDDTAIPARAKVTGSYINTALAVDEAHRHGLDDAIFLSDDGHVAEGSAANFFMVRHGKLITPPVSDNLLEGITRKLIMQFWEDMYSLPCIERRIDRTELYIADELFLVGTGAQVAPIIEVDYHTVGTAQVGPVASALTERYQQMVRGQILEYRKDLTTCYGR